MNDSGPNAALDDVLQEFVETSQRPDAETLEKLIGRYPRFLLLKSDRPYRAFVQGAYDNWFGEAPWPSWPCEI